MPLESNSVETLASRLWPEEATSRALRAVVLAFAGTALITLGAKVSVPFYPVPMTLQTLAVMLIGAVYGSRLGAATVALYLFEGAIGLPVFSQTPPMPSGLGYLLGPTGGFLFGFIGLAFLVGWFAERGCDRSLVKMGAVLLAASALLYVPGLVWLGIVVKSVGFSAKLLAAGLYPFVLGDLIKVGLAASAVSAGRTIVRRRA